MIATQRPAATRMRMRAASPLRSRPTRPPSHQIAGVSAAQSHASIKGRVSSPAGEMSRKPKPRGSSQRLAAVRSARNVQKAKMARTSRAVRRWLISDSGWCRASWSAGVLARSARASRPCTGFRRPARRPATAATMSALPLALHHLSSVMETQVHFMTSACTSCHTRKRNRPPRVFSGVQYETNGEKTMKKAITAVAVLALSGTLAFAATEGHEGFGGHGHGRHHRHGMFGKKMAEKLGLNDAQKAQIKDIKKSTREANAAFFEQSRATRKEFWEAKKAGDQAKMDSLKPALESQRAQMQDIRKAEQAKVLSVLTPDQQAKLDAMKAEWKAKRGNRQ